MSGHTDKPPVVRSAGGPSPAAYRRAGEIGALWLEQVADDDARRALDQPSDQDDQH